MASVSALGVYPNTVAEGGTGVATLTTAYGILAAGTTATGNIQTISPGSSPQVLVSNGASALATFQSLSSGALTWLASNSASASATVDFANLLTSTYDNYLVVIENLIAATASESLQMEVGTGSGPAYQTSGYIGEDGGASGNSSTAEAGLTTSIDITPSGAALMNNTANRSGSGLVLISNANSASNDKTAIAIMGYLNSSSTSAVSITSGRWESATVITSLRFLMSSGNITSGTFKLYGLTN